MRKIFLSLIALCLASCGGDSQPTAASSDIVIYPATIVTMAPGAPQAEAVAVERDMIAGVGGLSALRAQFPGAQINDRFSEKTILPGFIDPHVHMGLSSIQYATLMAPPWDIAGADGIEPGYPDRTSFLKRLRDLAAENSGDGPLIIYGYHDLVHGDLVRADLDAISPDRPLLVWHYSAHDFYLNSAALSWAKIDASLHDRFEGVGLTEDGELTGRIFEDALPYLLQSLAPTLLAPARVSDGMEKFSHLLRAGGVTTVADLGYGIFGLPFENANIESNWRSPEAAGYRLYLVPEHRAFERTFGDDRVNAVIEMASGERAAPAPVLAQVKFFTDAAFYSQTMRLKPPGYLAGQSKGTNGLWVLQPDAIAETIAPYWEAGLGVRIHSNGDAAQEATLDALAALRRTSVDRRFVIEHGGVFSPEDIERAGVLGAVISAASHYVYYLGEAYQEALGAERGQQISPLASLSAAGAPVTLHSDAPLAPPLPLRAASVHALRSTREGGVLTPQEALAPLDALEAITIDAAYALGLEGELGSIETGKRADFTILGANPLEAPPEEWPDIDVWGVVLNGEPRAASARETP